MKSISGKFPKQAPGGTFLIDFYCLEIAVCPSRRGFTKTSSSVTEEVTNKRPPLSLKSKRRERIGW